MLGFHGRCQDMLGGVWEGEGEAATPSPSSATVSSSTPAAVLSPSSSPLDLSLPFYEGALGPLLDLQYETKCYRCGNYAQEGRREQLQCDACPHLVCAGVMPGEKACSTKELSSEVSISSSD